MKTKRLGGSAKAHPPKKNTPKPKAKKPRRPYDVDSIDKETWERIKKAWKEGSF